MSEAPGFERSDISARGVVLAMVALFATVAIFFGVVGLILYGLTPKPTTAPSPLAPQQVRSGWRLEVNPADNQRQAQNIVPSQLDAYGWTDRDAGRAKIPIERAMQILAGQGWPDRRREEGR